MELVGPLGLFLFVWGIFTLLWGEAAKIILQAVLPEETYKKYEDAVMPVIASVILVGMILAVSGYGRSQKTSQSCGVVKPAVQLII